MIWASGGAVVGALGALWGRPRGFLGPLGAILDCLGAVLARPEAILSRLEAHLDPQEAHKAQISNLQPVFVGFEAQKGSVIFGSADVARLQRGGLRGDIIM